MRRARWTTQGSAKLVVSKSAPFLSGGVEKEVLSIELVVPQEL
jgi:hypothetical protein